MTHESAPVSDLHMPTDPRSRSHGLDLLTDPAATSLFWRADRIGAASAWWLHVPFAHWLVDAAKPGVIVELGTATGVSFSAFCLAVQNSGLGTRCYAVDTWRGDVHTGQYDEEVFQEFRRFHDERFAGFSTLLRCTFDEALDRMADRSIDLLHIDGLHTFDEVRHDFLSWLPKLSDKAVVLFHDTHERSEGFGVWRLWAELAARYPSFEFLHGHGLGVLAVGHDAPAAVKSLCALCDPELVVSVRNRFAALGERWLRETQLVEANRTFEQNLKKVLSEDAQMRAALELKHAQALVEEKKRAERERAELGAGYAAALTEAEARIEWMQAGHERSLERARHDAERRLADAVAHANHLMEMLKSAELRGVKAHAAASASAIQVATIENSTIWRATRPIRSGVKRFPRAARNVRKGLRVLRWAVTGQLPRRLRELRLIASSGYFDRGWYLQRYPDIAGRNIDPLIHYASVGGAERRSPGPLFDSDWYSAAYPDVAASGIDPLVHYLQVGRAEGRYPTKQLAQLCTGDGATLFDADWYLERNPDVRAMAADPVVHFSQHGYREGRSPHPLFDVSWYLEQNPDVRDAGINPLLHFIEQGWKERRNPNPDFDITWYLDNNPDVRSSGVNPLVHYVRYGRIEGRAPTPRSVSIAANALMEMRIPTTRPLPILSVKNTSRRLTVVTDTLEQSSFFGGVATSLIVATALARASDRTLRIATRVAYPNADNYLKMLAAYGEARPPAIETYSDFDLTRAGKNQLDVSPSDVFLTTSWWSTYALLKAGFSGKVFYIIQECEPMFYPHSDEQLQVRRILADERVHFIVNSRLLFDYLVGIDEYRGVARSHVVFEPAFPAELVSPSPTAFHPKDRYRLFFYARPQNPRNLFETGLGILDTAVREGILDTSRVEICFAGSVISPLDLSTGYRPTILGKMDWSEYFVFLKSVDLALALMYTPHPSYPPLDVAASGGVAITNRYANKVSLDGYSRNIRCFDLMDDDSMRSTVESAVTLAMDPERRRTNYETSRLSRSWSESLRETIEFFDANT